MEQMLSVLSLSQSWHSAQTLFPLSFEDALPLLAFNFWLPFLLQWCFWGLGTWGWWSREMRGQLGWDRGAVHLWRISCVSREMEKQQFPLLHLSYHGSGRPCASQHLFLPVSAISALHLVAWPHTPPQISLSEEFLWPQAVHPWSPSPVGRRRGVVPASSPTVFVGAVQSQDVSRKHNKN